MRRPLVSVAYDPERWPQACRPTVHFVMKTTTGNCNHFFHTHVRVLRMAGTRSPATTAARTMVKTQRHHGSLQNAGGFMYSLLRLRPAGADGRSRRRAGWTGR